MEDPIPAINPDIKCTMMVNAKKLIPEYLAKSLLIPVILMVYPSLVLLEINQIIAVTIISIINPVVTPVFGII